MCRDIPAAGAIGLSGTIYLTSVANGAYGGNLEVNLQNSSGGSDQVTGTFNTSNCAGLGALIGQNRTTTCI